MSKQTVYIPIPVSSGELPERNGIDERYSIFVFGYDKQNDEVVCFYDFKHKAWFNKFGGSEQITSWLKKVEIDIPDEEPTNKVEVKWEDNQK